MAYHREHKGRKRSSRKSPPSHKSGKASREREKESFAPRIHRAAITLLKDIGKPQSQPFVPDPFQLESVGKVLDEDVLVSAPTGSGKTWIALEATKEFLSRGKRVWYATPLKALSNAKKQEFGEALSEENVGILTGDRKENPDAPVIVGTTEILRNQLYDAMQTGVDLDVDLVILDEAHYLGDPDRGVVWEEVLIYLPSRVRLLLLSATISNANTVARWLTHIRKSPCSVVSSVIRPVPLHPLFVTSNNELTPLMQGKRLFPAASKVAGRSGKTRSLAEKTRTDFNEVIEILRRFNLLPAIVFLKSRSACDKALEELKPLSEPGEENGFHEILENVLEPYPELKHQRQMTHLTECRAAAHHAGQLPAWRMVIEKLMCLGHLNVIFSTSTVAAGVNFPARTVVLLQSDRFDGRSFTDMTATDLHQMTGRAGRRGMDKTGFILVVPGRYMKIVLVKSLLGSPPEPLQSRIGVNSSMTLNLLLSHDPEGVKKLLGYSFASFHENLREAKKVHRRLLKSFQKHLNLLVELDYVDENGTPTYDGKWAARLRLDHPLLIAQLIRDGALNELNPEELAACIAPFVIDKDREVFLSQALWSRTDDLWKKFRRMMKQLSPLMGFMAARGFKVPQVMFWPSAAVFLWAHEVPWDDLTFHVGAAEGDLAMLMLRTADHVRQLISLGQEEPQLAETARKALPLLMRPPLL
jgi:ATP-dependent RNA helicase HelY